MRRLIFLPVMSALNLYAVLIRPLVILRKKTLPLRDTEASLLTKICFDRAYQTWSFLSCIFIRGN